MLQPEKQGNMSGLVAEVWIINTVIFFPLLVLRNSFAMSHF